jgi:hypothetical protein
MYTTVLAMTQSLPAIKLAAPWPQLDFLSAKRRTWQVLSPQQQTEVHETCVKLKSCGHSSAGQAGHVIS